MLDVEVIRDFPRLCAIRDQWSSFTPNRILTPFQTPEWLLTWWEYFGSGELRVFVFRDDRGKLVALVPCFLHEWMGRQQLTLLGSGISDYLDPVIAPEYRGEAVDCLAAQLRDNIEWDVCDWQDLLPDSPLGKLNRDADFSMEQQRDVPCSEIPIGNDFNEFWLERPHGLRRNVRRYSDKACQIATPQFAVTSSFDHECFESLVRLHSLRWQEHGESGTIVANRSAAFLREVSKEFARQKMLLFFSLRFQGEIVAVILSFPHGNVLFSYLSAFDPVHSALGFGRILLYDAVRYAFDEHYTSWNFLRGTEPYKFDWGAREIPKQRLIITR